jgi:hypothetical protein
VHDAIVAHHATGGDFVRQPRMAGEGTRA